MSIMTNKYTTFHLYDIIVFRECLHIPSQNIVFSMTSIIIDEETNAENLRLNSKRSGPLLTLPKDPIFLTALKKKIIHHMNGESYVNFPPYFKCTCKIFLYLHFLKSHSCGHEHIELMEVSVITNSPVISLAIYIKCLKICASMAWKLYLLEFNVSIN